jgi:AAA domain, putative AbiEii toxin, Type IV TA system
MKKNIKYESKAYLKDSTLAFKSAKPVQSSAGILVSSKSGYSPENPSRYSKLEEDGRERDILPWMQVLEPRLKRLSVLVTGHGPIIHGDIGIGKMVPLPFMGEGCGRLLTLLLSIVSSRNGVVMVDEIEVGLHYSVMTKVWSALAEACRQYNVQLIATTHGWECLRSASESFGQTNMYDFKVHRLDRRDDDVECVTYDREMIETALESGLELR